MWSGFAILGDPYSTMILSGATLPVRFNPPPFSGPLFILIRFNRSSWRSNLESSTVLEGYMWTPLLCMSKLQLISSVRAFIRLGLEVARAFKYKNLSAGIGADCLDLSDSHVMRIWLEEDVLARNPATYQLKYKSLLLITIFCALTKAGDYD